MLRLPSSPSVSASRAAVPRQRSLRAPARAPLTPLRAKSGSAKAGADAAGDAVGPVQRLSLLRRELEFAVQAEDYKRAAEIRDTLTNMMDGLSERQQAMAVTLSRLSSKDAAERKGAATLLGEIGDASCVPAMAFALTDTDAEVHKAVEEAIWRLFMRSGNAEVDARMQQGMNAMMQHPHGLEKAKELFTQVIELAPDFAEGYNKRATVHYLLKDFRASIADCEKVVSLQPVHFGALSGAGLCFVGLQDYPSALSWFKRALAVNPGMAQIRHYDRILRSALAVQEEAKAKAETLRRSRAAEGGDGEGPGAAGGAPPSSSAGN